MTVPIKNYTQANEAMKLLSDLQKWRTRNLFTDCPIYPKDMLEDGWFIEYLSHDNLVAFDKVAKWLDRVRRWDIDMSVFHNTQMLPTRFREQFNRVLPVEAQP